MNSPKSIEVKGIASTTITISKIIRQLLKNLPSGLNCNDEPFFQYKNQLQFQSLCANLSSLSGPPNSTCKGRKQQGLMKKVNC